jgi:hypothetical protein
VPCVSYVAGFSSNFTAVTPGVITSTATITWCIKSVTLKPQTGNLEFNVTWSGTGIAGVGFSEIQPMLGNFGFYVSDDQGQRYDHIATNGVALVGGSLNLRTSQPIDGTFVFPPATDGARGFTFYDTDHQVALSGITLAGMPQSP